jgi:hypothetical protein
MESKLNEFNEDCIPNLFTLENNGMLCYLNSLIQALMSCSSIITCLKKCQGSKSFSENKLARLFLEIYERNSGVAPKKKCRIDDASEILLEINIARQGKDNLLPGRQEDIHEGLMLFLETIGCGLIKLFHVRHTLSIYCKTCKVDRPAGCSCPSEPVIDLSEVDPILQENLDTKQSVEKYIQQYVQVSTGYTCENCGTVNTYNKETNTEDMKVIQIYRLAKLSEIIVLMFKKYNGKSERYFPPTLEFSSKTGKLFYKIVAQIEHSGGRNSGHYICKCLRVKPPGMHENRVKNANVLINKYEEILKDPGTSNAMKLDATERLSRVKELIANDEELRKDKCGVFLVSDGSASFYPEGFSPNSDTYMVFYHLYEP